MAYDPEFDIEYPDAPPIPFDAPAPAATIQTVPTGVGPSIGSTGGYDPETGDRYTSQFRYTPVQQGGGGGGGYDDMIRQAYEQSMAFLNPPPAPHGNTPYWENPNTYYPQNRPIDPVEQAKAASAMAYKYIGLRGYQQALKEGKSAAEAFAQWGPLVVGDAGGFASGVKALQPQPSYKYNEATRAYEAPLGGRPVFNPHAAAASAPVWVPANPKTGEPAHYLESGKVQFTPNAPTAKIDPFTLSDYKDVGAEYDRASKIYADPSESAETRKEAITRMAAAQGKMNLIRKAGGLPPSAGSPTAQVAASPTPAPAATATPTVQRSEVRIPVKDKNGKKWTIPEWQLPLAQKQGFTLAQ